jgi:hypothetical protein
MNETVLEFDIEFAFNSLQKAISNERCSALLFSPSPPSHSAWNYLGGLRKKYQAVFPVSIGLCLIDRSAHLPLSLTLSGWLRCCSSWTRARAGSKSVTCSSTWRRSGPSSSSSLPLMTAPQADGGEGL